jgi:hypothetical protein
MQEGYLVKKSTLKKALAAMICGLLMWTACSTGWIGEAEQIVAVLIPATANLLSLIAALQGLDISAADAKAIQSAGSQAEADLQLMESLVVQYGKADTATQAGLLSQIQVSLGSVQSDLNGLLPALHIEDAATKAKVTAVVGVLISEVESMAAIVPLASGNSPSAVSFRASAQAHKHVPLTASKFVSSYNATMTAKTGNAELDRAASGLRIHSHGELERWASGGLLK